MKKFIVICFWSLLFNPSNPLNAQVALNLNYKGEYIKSGKKAEVKEFFVNDLGALRVWMIIDGKDGDRPVGDLKDLIFDVKDSKNFWFDQAIKGNVYGNISKNPALFQYDLRKEMELDALDYLEKLEENHLILEDRFLENYLYSLVYKIYPGSLEDGRPGIVNVTIVKDVDPNAFICPNGSMIITTGLLTIINSDEELIAVMAHEISHFVLDHAVINVNKATQRQKRAEFWAAFATGLAAASDIYLASQNEYYVPGALTYSTAVLSYTIASEINARLGLQFTREQEIEADNCTVELLKLNQIDPTALSSVLNKIKNYCIINGDYYSISGEGTHPALAERIKNIGVPKDFPSSSFDRTFSSIISLSAILEFNSKHFKACQNLVNRNIKAGVPTEDDYILKATTNLYLFNNDEKNNEALDLINKAKALNISPTINLYKQEALALIRLNRNQDAIKAFENYLSSIDQWYIDLDKIKNERSWALTKDYLDKEKEWTAKMIYKLQKS